MGIITVYIVLLETILGFGLQSLMVWESFLKSFNSVICYEKVGISLPRMSLWNRPGGEKSFRFSGKKKNFSEGNAFVLCIYIFDVWFLTKFNLFEYEFIIEGKFKRV